MNKNVRVRFAPSPTGFMHLGNVRALLMNFLFARQHNGTLLLRIEDTDAARNLDQASAQIVTDMKWLGIGHDEGPDKGGNFGPYLQSERKEFYDKVLFDLQNMQRVYRCFCTPDRLAQMREHQAAAGKPPRYDRRCLNLPSDKIKAKLDFGVKFVWRFKFNDDQLLSMTDLARGTITFDTKNFSDFVIARGDGSHTFTFANFVDDYLMKITHVIRGEDHLSNTSMQLALYDAYAVKPPIFWHLPILANLDGQKLSKRDFGFSLVDLRNAGYLPEAICNYLASIGASLKEEIQSMGDLIKNYDFKNIHATGSIKYDVDKLTWLNQKWISKISCQDLLNRLKPELNKDLPESASCSEQELLKLLEVTRCELKALCDAPGLLTFYCKAPNVTRTDLAQFLPEEKISPVLELIKTELEKNNNGQSFVQSIKKEAKAQGFSLKELWIPLRVMLTGSKQGLGINDLFAVLSYEEVKKRVQKTIC